MTTAGLTTTPPRLSLYPDITTEKPSGETTLANWLAAIHGGRYQVAITTIREAAGTPAYGNLKNRLPCVTYGGFFPDGSKNDSPYTASPYVFLDWDQHGSEQSTFALEMARARLASHPSVVAVYTSAGGAGLHIVAAVEPIPQTPAEYRSAWASVTHALELGAQNDSQVAHAGRLACASYDPHLYYRATPIPIHWTPAATATATRQTRPRMGRIAEGFAELSARHGGNWDQTALEEARRRAVAGAVADGQEEPDQVLAGNKAADAFLVTGFRMPCAYHGGTNATSLRIWAEPYEVGKGRNARTLWGLRAHCHSHGCDPNAVIRWLTHEADIRWPAGALPPGESDREYAVQDVLAMVRLELRLELHSGLMMVRTMRAADGQPLPPDRIIAESGVPYSAGDWAVVTDTLIDVLLLLCERYVGDFKGGSRVWRTTLVLTARRHPETSNDVIDWLYSLPAWDGEYRKDFLWQNALGAADTQLHREASGRFLVGAVARILESGITHDWIPVLTGEQVLGKSRSLRDLLPPKHQLDWYADGVSLDEDKQRIHEGIGGAILVEFSEMAGYRSARAVEHFKSFLDTRVDRYRRPYAYAATDNKREWVGAGTTNCGGIPPDPTGSRRYALVECGDKADWSYIPKNRDMLWAEALATFRQWDDAGRPGMPPNLLSLELRPEQEIANATATETTAAMDRVLEYLGRVGHYYPTEDSAQTAAVLWDAAVQASWITGRSIPPMDRSDAQAFPGALLAMGWRRTSKRIGATRANRYWYPLPVAAYQYPALFPAQNGAYPALVPPQVPAQNGTAHQYTNGAAPAPAVVSLI